MALTELIQVGDECLCFTSCMLLMHALYVWTRPVWEVNKRMCFKRIKETKPDGSGGRLMSAEKIQQSNGPSKHHYLDSCGHV